MLSMGFTWAVWMLAASAAYAQSADEFFEKKIRPVLVEKCYACHSGQSKMPMGGLRLDSAAAIRKGGDSGPAIAPGNPSKSLLMEAIRYASLRIKMPPAGKLPAEQIADFEQWITMGAHDPRTEAPAALPAKKDIDWQQARQFWSFQMPVKTPAPPVKNSAWVKTPIDAFLLSALEKRGFPPAPPADKRTWIRRVTFDLIGLPPSPSEVDDYLRDTSPEADRKVVERLLASKHYGERWARHWLDLVRFAETNGHEFDNDKLDAWRYRDYVIRAFNQDVPYNQFAKEHIAGDLLPAKRLSQDGTHWESPLGTGVFWFGEVLNSATDSVKTRADAVDNQIDVVGKAFLGLTVACARCHDHKFDPLPTADYYSLAGIMHSTYVREAVIDSPERARQIASAHQKIADINAEIDRSLPPHRSRPSKLQLREGDVLFEDFEGIGYENWTISGQAFGMNPAHTLPPNQPLDNYGGEGMANSFGAGTDALMGSLTSKKFRMPKLWVHVRMAGTNVPRGGKEKMPLRLTVVADDHKSEHFVAAAKPGFHWVSMRMTKEIGRTCYFELVDRTQSGHIAVDAIILSDHEKPPQEDAPPSGAPRREDERTSALQQQRAAFEKQIPPSVFGMLSVDEEPHNARLHIRGSHQNLGDEVPRQFLRIIAGDKQQPCERGSGRLELAEWIAGDRNPLTARVMVNRIWKHHFGQGLVRSMDNFGKLGEAPSNQALLDWLAVTFIERGWSVKEMHRLMVLSNAYRMSNQGSPEAAKADPRNDLLHHMPVQRLEGEAIRDAILSISGKLDPQMYGPGVTPHISKYQDGRGKPASGPLDGNGRRSIYIEVRRNFLTPMFLAFDYPLPISTIGARTVSTVPSQALMLLNNEFVAESARAWANKVQSEEKDPGRRIDILYAAAFARPPEDWEKKEALAFVANQNWTDLCHVLINSAEFIYVR